MEPRTFRSGDGPYRMMEPPRRHWLAIAVLAAVGYFLIGRLTTIPADQRFWRPAAWLGSAVVFAAHIADEHFRLRSSPTSTALHTAVAVAIGAFGLAVAAFVHSFSVPSRSAQPALFVVALVAWPLVTAIPAYVVALVAAMGLARIRRA